uniref:Uncharacterized protein n=1 Tax=Rhizophora mucronata TaxID=61149 RepID=A0A2P2PYV4_RHIMU
MEITRYQNSRSCTQPDISLQTLILIMVPLK